MRLHIPSYVPSHGFCAIVSARFATCSARNSIVRSLSTSALQTSLYESLTTRPTHELFDHLNVEPVQALNATLAGILPPPCLPGPPLSLAFSQQGLHLLYFPELIKTLSLLPDGTDTVHSPGDPFVRRLWAGGSLSLPRTRFEKLGQETRSIPISCQERIADVQVRGQEGDEKIFVTIDRRIAFGSTREDMRSAAKETSHGPLNQHDEAVGLLESRILVFMRAKSTETARLDLEKTERLIKPIHVPDYSVALTPTPAFLFRFSALTFNAHRIHLDRQYCREIEGHRDLLVHGPLSLILMLSVLRSQLQHGQIMSRFDYKNLAPLYVDEEMKICVRKTTSASTGSDLGLETYDVWIEGKNGGYAVKACAEVRDAPMTYKA